MRAASFCAVIGVTLTLLGACHSFGADTPEALGATDAAVSDAPAPALDVSARALPDAGVDGPRATPRYAEEVLADMPLLYYRLGEGGGDESARNEMPGAQPGTYRGDVERGVVGALAGDANTAVQFGGGDAELHIPATAMPDFAGTAAFSLEIWAKPAVEPMNYPHLVAKESGGSGGAPREGYALYIEDGNNNGYAFERWSGDQNKKAVHGERPKVGEFTHVIGTFDGQSLVLYVNGMEVARTLDGSTVQPQADVAGRIGAGPNVTRFNGVLDEVAVYDRALTPERVLAHFQAASR